MPAWVVPAIMGAASLVGSWIGNARQKRENRAIAKYQAQKDQEFLAQQNAYNEPKSQMLRFQEAGLNPNLVYGQGNPGNQSSPQQYPEQKTVDYGDMGVQKSLGLATQAGLTQSQIQATNANTRRTGVLTELNRLQADVVAANPLLNETGFNAIITSLKATAESKVANAGMDTLNSEFYNMQGIGKYGGMKLGEVKMFKELELLEQKFNLGAADAKIKAQIIDSKEFQNAILEVQKKFMTDAELTPQHVLQFVQLLLMKFLTFKPK